MMELNGCIVFSQNHSDICSVQVAGVFNTHCVAQSVQSANCLLQMVKLDCGSACHDV